LGGTNTVDPGGPGVIVYGGTLQIGIAGSGSLAAVAGRTATVNAGGSLAGSGTVSLATTVNAAGSLSPGDTGGAASGTLSFGATGLTLASGSTATFQLQTADTSVNDITQLVLLSDPATVGLDDFVNVGGPLSVSAGSLIQLDFTGYTAQAGAVFDLFDFTGGSLGGTPSFSVIGGSLGGFRIDSSRFATLGVIAFVPEPSRSVLGAAFLVLLGLRRRR
jgi:hypothetical protein